MLNKIIISISTKESALFPIFDQKQIQHESIPETRSTSCLDLHERVVFAILI